MNPERSIGAIPACTCLITAKYQIYPHVLATLTAEDLNKCHIILATSTFSSRKQMQLIAVLYPLLAC